MGTLRLLGRLGVGLICLLVTVTARSNAQTKEDPESFMRDVLGPIFGPNWSLFAQGGATTFGRFLLQSPGVGGGQRALRSETGYNVGGGAGVDVLMHVGFRATYS